MFYEVINLLVQSWFAILRVIICGATEIKIWPERVTLLISKSLRKKFAMNSPNSAQYRVYRNETKKSAAVAVTDTLQVGDTGSLYR